MTAGVLTVGSYSLSPTSLAVLVTAVMVVVIGLVPLRRREALQESLFFFLLCLAIATWLFGLGWAYASPDEEVALRWVQLAYFGIPVIPAVLYTVTVHALGVADRRRAWLAGLWLGTVGSIAVITGTDVLITGVRRYSWGFYPTYSPAGVLFIAFVVIGLGASLREYWRQFREAKRDDERKRAGMYLLAFSSGSLAVIDFLPCYGVEVYPVGYVAILAMCGLISYTLRNFRLTAFTPAFTADRILSTITDPVVVCDGEGTIRLVNDAVAETLGYEQAELLDEPFGRLVHQEGGASMGWAEVLERERVVDEELVLAARDGQAMEVSISASAVHDSKDVRVGTAIVARDIRERKELEDQLRHQALHDPLTGLANRVLFEDRVGQLLNVGKRHDDREIGVLYLDLDRFKIINDTYGHSVGDETLQRVAGRIDEVIRAGDTAARLGGDEFAVALSDLRAESPEEEAQTVARRLVEAIGAPLEIDGNELLFSASVGVAIGDGSSVDAPSLIRQADLAMYHVKSGTGSQVAVFEPRLEEAAVQRTRIERDLAGVAERGELRVVFHPVLDLSRDRAMGMEALLRWEHPELGRLAPRDFISLAEETGRIVELGRWVLNEACRQMEKWRGANSEATDLRVMVNVSEPEIMAGNYTETVEDALATSGLPPDALELEITERMVISEPEMLDSTLRRMRDLGVHVTIDDFGTGTSSLQMVRSLHLDGLKIDHSFIHRVSDDDRGLKFVQSILELARELGLDVVAEGVEEKADLDALQELGVERAQGFLWSEPLPAEDVPEFLAKLPGPATD